VNKINR